MADAVVVIPARWASTRFPGKVLAPLGGKPLLLWVCEAAAGCRRAREVIVASDDERVLEAARAGGFRAERTRADHRSGTDRVVEVARGCRDEIVLGLQGDEPFVAPADLDGLIAAVADGPDEPALGTLAAPLAGREDWLDPNIVKVVVDRAGRALYFSRSPIPYRRPKTGLPAFPPDGEPPAAALHHVGVYAWRRGALLRFVSLPPSPLEESEGLEQLRALEAGWTIRVFQTRTAPLGVDTPADLERAERRLARDRGRQP